MRIFTLPNGDEVQASDQFEIGDQKYPGGWLAVATNAEISEIGIKIRDVADPEPPKPVEMPKPSSAELAQDALDATDAVAIRCFKAGVAYPKEWQDYTAALRAIVRSGTGDLPPRPAYPMGT